MGAAAKHLLPVAACGELPAVGGVREQVGDNKVLLGLSGGIDSALTAAMAVDEASVINPFETNTFRRPFSRANVAVSWANSEKIVGSV